MSDVIGRLTEGGGTPGPGYEEPRSIFRGVVIDVIHDPSIYDEEQFEDLERTIASKLFEVTGMMRDTRAKGISQPQYISYDPEGYLNDRALFYEEQE